MTNRIVRGNLFHRKTRTLMTVLAVALEVAMILMILGLSDGLIEESAQRKRGIGAHIVIRPAVSTSLFTTGTNGLPESLVDQISAMPGVAVATGTTISVPTNLQTITGVDWEKLDRMTGGIRFIEGGPFKGPFDIIVDTVYARQRKIHLGDTLRVLNQDFHVVGIIESGKMARVFVPLATMQKLMGWQGEVSQIYVRLKDPSQTDAMIAQLKEKLPDHPIYSMDEFISLFTAQTRDMASSFVDAIMGIALAVGMLVVLLSMYTAVLDRTRDIGILKALGASKAYVIDIFLRETLWMTLAGILLGALIAWAGGRLVDDLFPLVTMLTLPRHVILAIGIAIFGSLAGALVPALQAAGKDPIAALSYE